MTHSEAAAFHAERNELLTIVELLAQQLQIVSDEQGGRFGRPLDLVQPIINQARGQNRAPQTHRTVSYRSRTHH